MAANSCRVSCFDRAVGRHLGRSARLIWPTSPRSRSSTSVVQEDGGLEGLVLCGGRHVAIGREVVQKVADVRGIEVPRLGRVVKVNVADDPPAVALFRVMAKLMTATGRVDPVKERGRGIGGRRGMEDESCEV